MAKILICDDSQFMRNVIKDALNSSGHELIEAENGKQALETYTTEKPDLLLLDIIMPEMDGIEVLKQLGEGAKVIVVSAVGQDKMVEEAKSLGALDYIVKPFEEGDILEKVGGVLGE
jgi:two-component system, chemotaxis family, chemotaxis protein CheY